MKKELFLVTLLFILFTIFLFRSYIINGLVPLPFNLLVSFYSPWKYEEQYKIVGNKPLGFDNLKLFYPFRKYTTDVIKKKHIPLWNPYVFSGNVHLATYQSMILYPLTILYWFLPQVDAWTVLIMLQPILSGLFMYLFLRSIHRTRQAAFLGALGFAYSLWMITNWEEVLVQVHTILYLPLALYASNLLWNGKKRLGMTLLIFSCVFSVFGAFLQMSIYFFVTLFFWNIYQYFSSKNKPERKNTILLFILLLVLVFGITSLQWMPAIQAYFFSPRGVVDSKNLFSDFLSPFQFLLTFVYPDFWGSQGSYNYFGLFRFANERQIWIALPIFLFGICGFYVQKKEVRFWKWFTIIAYSLGFNIPTSWIFYMLQIPILSAAQPSRIFIIATLGFIVLSAYGFDLFFEEKLWSKYKHIIFFLSILIFLITLFLCIISIILIFTHPTGDGCKVFQYIPFSFYCNQERLLLYSTISLRNVVIPTALFVGFWFVMKTMTKYKTIIFVIALVLLLGSVTYQAKKILYFSQRSYEYPMLPVISKLQELTAIDRVLTIGEGAILRNFLSYYRIPTADGYDALFPQWYGELLYSIKTKGKLSHQITRTDADLSPPGQGESLTDNSYRLRLIQIMGIKYIVETKIINPTVPTKELPSDLFPILWEDSKWRIYEYKNTFPRAFLATHVIVESDPQKLLTLLYSSTIDLSKTVLLEKQPSQKFLPGNTPGIADITLYHPEKIRINTVTDTDQFLFLSDTYAPGWKAFIDNKETIIYKANFAFRAVLVPRGLHTIEFRYEPQIVRIAFLITLISALIFSIIIFLTHRTNDRLHT